MHPPTAGAPNSMRHALGEAISRTQDYFLRTQHPDGYWLGELETNVCIAAEYLLLTHFLGVADGERWRKIATYLRRQQSAAGTWALYYGGPPDLNATVEAYFALKLAGASPDERQMLYERRVNRPSLDHRGHRSPNVHEGEELGLGKTLAEDLEYFFASAHSGQPVVDEGDARLVAQRHRGWVPCAAVVVAAPVPGGVAGMVAPTCW